MSIQFINRLKSIMKDRKITQTELAKRTGIRQSSISDWLNDRYEPKQDKVYIIAKALNVSPAWLLGYDENIPTNEQATNYYLDAETAEYAEMLRTRPEMRMLFSASRGISKEEMQEFVTDGGLPYDLHYVNRTIKKLSFHKPVSTHTFRHTHISILAESNVPLKAIMERVGHNEPRTTLAIYTHVTDEMKQEVNAAISNMGKVLANK